MRDDNSDTNRAPERDRRRARDRRGRRRDRHVRERNGDPGSYGVMSAVGGVAYSLSLAALHFRR